MKNKKLVLEAHSVHYRFASIIMKRKEVRGRTKWGYAYKILIIAFRCANYGSLLIFKDFSRNEGEVESEISWEIKDANSLCTFYTI